MGLNQTFTIQEPGKQLEAYHVGGGGGGDFWGGKKKVKNGGP